MALVLKDRVKETTTSTGAGTINLAGAATGFEDFVSAVGDGNTCYYAILDANGSAWEVGIGTVTNDTPDTLSRTTILNSSNSDSHISLTSGTHTVFLTYPADKSVYRNTNDQIVATASGIVFSDSTVQTTAPVDTNTTYTAGSGLQLDSTTFNAKTATTSASGITTLTNTIDSTQTKALTPKAVNDAGYLTSHPSISAASDSNNSGRTYIQDLLLDSNGHVTGITTATETVTDTNTTYTAGSGLQLNGAVFEALTATTSGSGITILTNTINSDQDKALTPKSVNDAGYLTAHPSISAASSSNNSSRTYIQDILLDTNGHVTGIATAAETVTDTNTTYTAGSGLQLNSTTFDALTATTSASGITTLTNTINSDQDKALTPKAVNDASYLTAHPSISAASSSNNSGRTYIQDVLLDSNGHVTGIATAAETVTDTNTTYTGGTNLTLAGTTFNVDDAFLVNNADDTTTGTITAGGLSTTGVVALGESTYQHKFDRYKLTGVTSSNAVAITLGGSALSDHYAYRIRCYDEDSSNLNGSVFLVRENNANNGWDVKTVSIQKNSSGEFPEVFDDSGTVKVKTGTGSARDIIVYIEAIFINRNDVTGYIWGGDHIWSKVTNAGGTLDNIYTTGNVGINTETPAYPLDVNGTGNFSTIRFSDGTTQTTAGGGGSARSVAGDTDNGVITWVTSDNTFAAESSLTFDGTDLNIATGSIEVRTIDYSDGDNALTIADGGAVTFAKSINQAANTATDGGAVNIDCGASNYHEVLMNANATSIVFTNVTPGQRVIVRFKQHSTHIDLDANDGWDTVTVDGSSATLKWGGGVTPTLTETNNAVDVYGFIFESTKTNVMGFIIAQDVK